MQSEQNPTSPSPSTQHGAPRADEILNNFKHAEDPMEFIRNNLKPREPSINMQQAVDAARPAPAPQPQQVNTMALEQGAGTGAMPLPQHAHTVAPVEAPTPVPQTTAHTLAKVEPQPQADPNAIPITEFNLNGEVEAQPQPEVQPDEFEGEVEIAPAAENFKKLRTKYKETAKTLREIQAEKVALQQKLTKYDAGEEAPEVVKHLQTRVAELEPYEQVFNLKRSPGYQTKFIQPLNELGNKLGKLAKDYEIPEQVMHEALDLKNRADLNRFLLNHFDEVGALEAKQLIGEMQKIKDGALEAEKEPVRVMQQLQVEHEQLMTEKDVVRKGTIAATAKDGWVKAVTRIRTEGKVQELIPRANDPEFNTKFVQPIEQQAAKEYGRMVRDLAENGLTQMTPDLAEALAVSALLSITSAVSIARANHAERYIEDLENNSQRRNGMIRPSIGGGSGTGSYAAPAPERPDSPLAAGRMIINKVLANSR